jgi:hypothetical protein
MTTATNTRKSPNVGLLELLFHFTAQYAAAGDIGRFPDDRIEGALFWAGRCCKPGTLIQAMIAAGWIDHDPVHRLVVHDWAQHADQATTRKLEREGRAFSAPARVRSDIKNESAVPERAVRVGCAQGDSGSTVLPTSSSNEDNGKMTSLPEPEPSQSHYKDKNPPVPPAAQTAADGLLTDLANRIHKRHLARRCPLKEVAKLLAGILKHPNIENRERTKSCWPGSNGTSRRGARRKAGRRKVRSFVQGSTQMASPGQRAVPRSAARDRNEQVCRPPRHNPGSDSKS